MFSILTAAAAIVGVWIALQQMYLARNKFEHEVFDKLYARRLAVYESTRTILAKTAQSTATDDDIRNYGLVALDAKFLFDDDLKLHRYLRELHRRVSTFIQQDALAKQEQDPETKKQHQQLRTEQFDWIVKQGDEHSGFDAGFMPFLKYTPHKPRFWFLC